MRTRPSLPLSRPSLELADTLDIKRLLRGDHNDPFAFLGIHTLNRHGPTVVRVFRPGAKAVHVVLPTKQLAALTCLHADGIFAGIVSQREPVPGYQLHCEMQNGQVLVEEDPYRFGLVLSTEDVYLLKAGRHWRSYDVLGAHKATLENVQGTSFALWAPDAGSVYLQGDFNCWDERMHPMRWRHDAGIWEFFLPYDVSGYAYQFRITDRATGKALYRQDPYARAFENTYPYRGYIPQHNHTPPHASIDVGHRHAAIKTPGAPILAFSLYTDRKSAAPLAQIVQKINEAADFGANHILLHSLQQDTDDKGHIGQSAFAPARWWGGAEGLKQIVHEAQRLQLGVLAAWNADGFQDLSSGLRQFDGSTLYESRHKEHHHHRLPNIVPFNHARYETANLLLANAQYWIEHFNLSGLFVWGVKDMLAPFYSLKKAKSSRRLRSATNKAALSFLRQLNELLPLPKAIMIADDAAWPGLTKPTRHGGLQFALALNEGWFDQLIGCFEQSELQKTRPAPAPTISQLLPALIPGSSLTKITFDDKGNTPAVRAGLTFLAMLPVHQWIEGLENAEPALQSLMRDLMAFMQGESALKLPHREHEGDFSLTTDTTIIDHPSLFICARWTADKDHYLLSITNFNNANLGKVDVPCPLPGPHRIKLYTDWKCYGGNTDAARPLLEAEVASIQTGDPHTAAQLSLDSLTAHATLIVEFLRTKGS